MLADDKKYMDLQTNYREACDRVDACTNPCKINDSFIHLGATFLFFILLCLAVIKKLRDQRNKFNNARNQYREQLLSNKCDILNVQRFNTAVNKNKVDKLPKVSE